MNLLKKIVCASLIAITCGAQFSLYASEEAVIVDFETNLDSLRRDEIAWEYAKRLVEKHFAGLADTVSWFATRKEDGSIEFLEEEIADALTRGERFEAPRYDEWGDNDLLEMNYDTKYFVGVNEYTGANFNAHLAINVINRLLYGAAGFVQDASRATDKAIDEALKAIADGEHKKEYEQAKKDITIYFKQLRIAEFLREATQKEVKGEEASTKFSDVHFLPIISATSIVENDEADSLVREMTRMGMFNGGYTPTNQDLLALTKFAEKIYNGNTAGEASTAALNETKVKLAGHMRSDMKELATATNKWSNIESIEKEISRMKGNLASDEEWLPYYQQKAELLKSKLDAYASEEKGQAEQLDEYKRELARCIERIKDYEKEIPYYKQAIPAGEENLRSLKAPYQQVLSAREAELIRHWAEKQRDEIIAKKDEIKAKKSDVIRKEQEEIKREQIKRKAEQLFNGFKEYERMLNSVAETVSSLENPNYKENIKKYINDRSAWAKRIYDTRNPDLTGQVATLEELNKFEKELTKNIHELDETNISILAEIAAQASGGERRRIVENDLKQLVRLGAMRTGANLDQQAYAEMAYRVSTILMNLDRYWQAHEDTNRQAIYDAVHGILRLNTNSDQQGAVNSGQLIEEAERTLRHLREGMRWRENWIKGVLEERMKEIGIDMAEVLSTKEHDPVQEYLARYAQSFVESLYH